MNKMIVGVLALLFGCGVYGQNRDFRIDVDPNRNPFGGRDVEMRDRYDPDPASRFRGEIDRDGSVRMRNYDGQTLRGEIDRDGYGRLRDDNGNVYRVRPR
jgi:hypothetical protein